jgi:hypothetical protein
MVPEMAVRVGFDEDEDRDMAVEYGVRVSDLEYKLAQAKQAKTGRIQLLTSEWVTAFIRIKDGDTGAAVPLVFDERKYLKRIYDTPARKVLLFTSRQTEKSTTIGNRIFGRAGMRPGHTSLFVSPSAMQTAVFSKTRLNEIIDISPLIKAQTHEALTNNLFEKHFANGSKIYLRYAFLTADRIRGLSVNDLFLDEIQDLVSTTMPVIEETTSHHQDTLFVYSGTPKSMDNNIHHYWADNSTASEWCIPCEHHGLPNMPATWHWNILSEKNLGKDGPICDRCGHAINPEHPYARWVEMQKLDNERITFEGYRVCRLMVPWFWKSPKKWKEILAARERYPTAQFMNEVLAISYDSASKPISKLELIQTCEPKIENNLETAYKIAQNNTTFFGIDWGSGERAFTVLTMGAYCRDDAAFQIFFMMRFVGPLTDPIAQMDEIESLVTRFRPKYVGTDFGFGFYQNKRLLSKFGMQRIFPFEYAARLNMKLKYVPKLHRTVAFRTPLMSDMFVALKRRKVRLPKWSTIERPYGDDFLNIHAEDSDNLRMIKYDKPKGKTDDSFHASLYCLLASMLEHKRPDIIAPFKEEEESRLAGYVSDDAYDGEIPYSYGDPGDGFNNT